MNALPLSDRPVVLITGCSSGIGRAAALTFARRGYRVFASVRRPGSADDLLAEATREGLALSVPILDVSNSASVDSAVAALLAQTHGRLDVVVNNAGYYLFGPVEEISADELSEQLDTNLVGVLRVIRAVLPTMRAVRRGAIVNLSSISGCVALPIAGPYHASKWGLEALTESLRYEVKPFGVRVTCIQPGPIETNLHTKEKRALGAGSPSSPYAPLLQSYERQLRGMRRAPVQIVAERVFKAATSSAPRLRWPVGPTSIMSWARGLVPDAIFELAMGLIFRWRSRR